METNILLLCGRTASGKTTVAKELEKLGLRRIITYTTRSPRRGETRDVSYHFISREDFVEKKERGFFAEWRSYDSASGEVFYGSAKKDYAGEGVFAILDPSGAKAVKEIYENAMVIYFNASDGLIMERLKKRGDSAEEIRARLASDTELFSGFESMADLTFHLVRDYEPELLAEIVAGFVRKGEEDGKG